MGITASISPAPDANTTTTWTAPDGTTKPFSDYDWSKTHDQYTALDTTAFQANPHFYNARNGSATVTCNCTFHGIATNVTGILTVARPTATMSPHPGAMQADATSSGNIQLRPLAPPPDQPDIRGRGIDWTGSTVTVPSPFKPGSFAFLQKGAINRSGYEFWNNGSGVGSYAYHHPQNGMSGLDGTAPYFGNDATDNGHIYATGTSVPQPTATSLNSGVGDSPRQPYIIPTDSGTATFRRITVSNETYTTYMMFLPGCGDARWVPLVSRTWYWGGTATAVGTTYTGTDLSGPDPGTKTDVFDHPTWSMVIDPLKAWVQ